MTNQPTPDNLVAFPGGEPMEPVVDDLPGEELPTISDQPGAPNGDLIQSLEQLLDLAKKGELQSFVGVGFASNEDRVTMWEDVHPNTWEMSGAIGALHDEYKHRHPELIGCAGVNRI